MNKNKLPPCEVAYLCWGGGSFLFECKFVFRLGEIGNEGYSFSWGKRYEVVSID